MAANDDSKTLQARLDAQAAPFIPPKSTPPTPAQVRALEERLGEWLPAGSHTMRTAKKYNP